MARKRTKKQLARAYRDNRRRLEHELRLKADERAMARAAAKGLRRQFPGLINVLRKHFEKRTPREDAAAYLNSVEGYMSAEVGPTMVGLYEEAGGVAIKQVVAGGEFELAHPEAVKYAREAPLKFAKRVNTNTKRMVRRHLATAIREHETMDEITRRMQGVFSVKRDEQWRARRIARTETNKVVNKGTLDGWEQSGVVEAKTWLSAFNARDAHAAASGQTVPLGEAFIVGGERLMHPGDPSGSPGNIINCRCTMQPGVLPASEQPELGPQGFEEQEEAMATAIRRT